MSTAVQWRELVELAATDRPRAARRARRACLGRAARRRGDRPRPSTTPSRNVQRGQRVATDERPAAPALAVLDRLEQEPVAVADDAGERGNGGDEVGEHAAPDRHDRCCAARAWNSSRVGRIIGAYDSGAEGPEEARVRAGVAGALALLFDHEQQRVAVAVVVGLADELAVAGGVALAPDSWRLRLQNTVRPWSSDMRSVSAFIHAIISTAGRDVLHDGGDEPVVVELDRAELLVGGGDGGGSGMAAMLEAVPHATARHFGRSRHGTQR